MVLNYFQVWPGTFFRKETVNSKISLFLTIEAFNKNKKSKSKFCRQSLIQFFETCLCFTKVLFNNNGNEGWVLVINMVNTIRLISCWLGSQELSKYQGNVKTSKNYSLLPSLCCKMKTFSILSTKNLTKNRNWSALFLMQTRAFLKYFVHDCLWKQVLVCNSPHVPSKLICLIILATFKVFIADLT